MKFRRAQSSRANFVILNCFIKPSKILDYNAQTLQPNLKNFLQTILG